MLIIFSGGYVFKVFVKVFFKLICFLLIICCFKCFLIGKFFVVEWFFLVVLFLNIFVNLVRGL